MPGVIDLSNKRWGTGGYQADPTYMRDVLSQIVDIYAKKKREDKGLKELDELIKTAKKEGKTVNSIYEPDLNTGKMKRKVSISQMTDSQKQDALLKLLKIKKLQEDLYGYQSDEESLLPKEIKDNVKKYGQRVKPPQIPLGLRLLNMMSNLIPHGFVGRESVKDYQNLLNQGQGQIQQIPKTADITPATVPGNNLRLRAMQEIKKKGLEMTPEGINYVMDQLRGM